MTIHLKGGRVVDPEHNRDRIGDLYITDGRIAFSQPQGRPVKETYDLTGKIVMAGAIDIHSHIAGANVSAARALLANRRSSLTDDIWVNGALPTLDETGLLYARMGFTTVVEPAMAPHSALQTQAELTLIPNIDRAALAILGNDDFALRLIRDKSSGSALADYVGRTLNASKAIGVKCINPGGVAAFKENIRSFNLDDVVPAYGVTSRDIVKALQNAVAAIGTPHPVHLHCNNLGLPGNSQTALATIAAAEGQRLHLAHLQFYTYAPTKKGGLASGAVAVAEAVNANKNITVDVGQVMFGPTVTISSDVPRQFAARGTAKPKKWMIADLEGNGYGVVPYEYKDTNKVSALQWAIGMELFLLIADPWRVFFTTDHPNGGHFTTYPKIMHLLMDADERARWIEHLPKAALKTSQLGSIKREYSLNEIAIMTRAAPARLYGLRDRGHLGEGAVADISVYSPQNDITEMFSRAHLVFKGGDLVVRDGEPQIARYSRTLYVRPPFDAQIDTKLTSYYEDIFGAPLRTFDVPPSILPYGEVFEEHPCFVS